MTSQLSSDEYLTQRVDDQIKWYSDKSRRNKRAYQWLRVGEIIAAALIPLLTGYINGQETTLKLTVGALGLVVAVISGLLALYRLQENWLQYRTTCEALIREKFCFLTQTSPYDTTQRFPLFVQRIEALLAEENAKWMQSVEKQDKQSPDSAEANN